MHAHNHRYSSWQIGAHWLTLGLLIAVYALIELHHNFPKGSSARELLKTWHFMLGLTVWIVTFARLPLRLVQHAPPITPTPAPWQQRLAQAMHATLYALLIVMPLLGWCTLSAKGKAIAFFGFELPPLLAADKALGKQLEEVHAFIGNLGYWLIGLHACAALYHHYLAHDDTLRRMWPRRH